MRFLLDECLSELAAQTMNVLTAGAHEYVYLQSLAPMGTDDEDIPKICADHDFQCLVTLNVRDFGKKKHIYEKILEADIHCLVLRGQPRGRNANGWLVSVLSGRLFAYSTLLSEAAGPTLLIATEQKVRAIRLADLITDLEGKSAGGSAADG